MSLRLLFISLALVMATACSNPETDSNAPTEVVVFAASSLQGPFEVIADELQESRVGVDIVFNFGSSATLVEQIRSGAPADVIATASEQTMFSINNLTHAPARFADNYLALAVPPANPGGITSLSDFADPDKKIALCAPEVPCGSAAAEIFSRAEITPSVDTYGADATATTTLVLSGEVDAALLYETDILNAGPAVRKIDVPQSRDVVATYFIAEIRESHKTAVAQLFVDFVLSERGQEILRDYGFVIE